MDLRRGILVLAAGILLAGASAVQVGTGTFVDPGTAARVLAGIREWMARKGAARVADIRAMLET